MTCARPRQSRLRRSDRKLLIGIICGVMIATILFVSFMMSAYELFTAEIEELNAQYVEEISTLNTQHLAETSELQATIQDLTAEVSARDEQIIAIQQIHEEEDTAVSLGLMKKYLYVIQDAPTNEGVTLDLIAYTDQLCRDRNVNPHLVWAIIYHESRYQANAHNPRTDARGLGQFIPRTGRAIYQDYLNLGTYSHDLAYDPYVNVELITEYLRDINTRCSNNRDVLDEYGGYTAGQYYEEIAAYMTNVGTDPTVMIYN